MSKLKIFAACLIVMAIACYACEKTPVDSKIFVERYLTGTDFTKWPIQSYVKLELKNKDTLKKDTIDLPIDTAIFNKDLQFIRGSQVVNFIVDATGDNITFKTQPDSTWRIDYVRTSSFKLIHQRKVSLGNDVMTYQIEQVFKK